MRHDEGLLVRYLIESGVGDDAIVALLKTHTLHHVEGGKWLNLCLLTFTMLVSIPEELRTLKHFRSLQALALPRLLGVY